ncbi:GW dipeptide domain-containing protein, partial [Desemzia sp. C1]|uniref:GW dipeptide domain-containing protein n=1 Tax=Desemzia sp. C1 TaxID=2892016 RepID=UPI001E36085D
TYGQKLNLIIDTYDLTQFDDKEVNGKDDLEKIKNLSYDEIISTTNIKDYNAYINGVTDGIYTAPKGTKNSSVVASSAEYFNKDVVATQESRTKNGSTWIMLYLNGEQLGWIEENGLSIYDEISSSKVTNYKALISRSGDTLNTSPWGTKGYQTVDRSDNYIGKEVSVLKEAVTRRATWALIRLPNGKQLWIDKAALDVEKIESSKAINYKALISRSGDTLNTAPWGTEGYQTVGKSDKYVGKEVTIVKEAVTRRATWALVDLPDGKQLWIDKKGLNIEKIVSTKDVKYKGILNRAGDTINTVPWGTEGYQTVAKSDDYLGQEVNVLKEATTRRAEWLLISLNGRNLGWIDAKALKVYDSIDFTKNVSYKALISRSGDTLNTEPWGTKNFKTIGRSEQYLNQEVTVLREAVTYRATWALVKLPNDKQVWIDKAALNVEKIESSKSVSYKALFSRSGDTLNTAPWGTEGYETVGRSDDYLGKEITVIKEAVTRRATWALVKLPNGSQVWVDKKGLDIEKIESSKSTNYKAVFSRSGDTLNTAPWGTEGYKTVGRSDDYIGKEITVIKEAITRRATWVLVKLPNGSQVWVDKKGLDIEKIISTTAVNYKARIVRATDSINTAPWGTEGYKTTDYSNKYFGAEVTVKKEAKTRRATWALIAFNGKELGWIDEAALKKLDPNKKVVVIDAGHGGSDPGAQRVGVREKDLNLSVAKKVQSKLKAAGYEVIMTRTNDTFIAVSERARIANISNADIFVSIHTNSFNGITSGIETFSYDLKGNAKNPLVANDRNRMLKSNTLSSSIQNSLISNTAAKSRGAKKANFHVLRETGMPAVLTEIGFIDNTTERNKLVTNSYQEKLANGITNGIKEYFRLVK